MVSPRTLSVALRGTRAGVGGSPSDPPPADWTGKRPYLPRSWGTPVPMPCSTTPAGSTVPGHSVRRHGPRSVHDEGSGIGYFEAQSPGWGTRGLRFAGWITPLPRKTRFSACGGLARFCRTGLVTRRVPPKGFSDVLDSYISSSSPKLRGPRTVTDYFTSSRWRREQRGI